jgi:NADPH:quinone reductase-like Zn-dependent oxidoreductase
MQAVVLRSYSEGWDNIAVDVQPVPRPGVGEVLIRVAAAPINPSDLAFLRGRYAFTKPLPAVPGIECSGTVVAAGSGMLARRLQGKRVACAASETGGGTWADYLVAPARNCLTLPATVSNEQGAMALVNPLTAWALVDIARKRKARAVLQTAAAGALGRMIARLCLRVGLEAIHIVRRPEHVTVLHDLGALHVLDSSDPDFDRRLADLCRRLGASLAFDAVAGEMTGRLLAAMPSGSQIVVYGALSWEACAVDPATLIFSDKSVTGFYLVQWLRHKRLLSLIRLQRQVMPRLTGDLHSEIQARFALADARQALQTYESGMTRGKVLFTPSRLRTGVNACSVHERERG